MVVRAAYRLARLGLAFVRDRRGSNTVEFVISVPILLAVLVLSTEYGKILHMRTVLDSAVADATRYLSRVPLDANDRFNDDSIEVAYRIIAERIRPTELTVTDSSNPTVTLADLGVTPGDGVVGAMAIEGPEFDADFSFDVVALTVQLTIPSPALSVLNIARPNTTNVDGRDVSDGITIHAQERFTHFGR